MARIVHSDAEKTKTEAKKKTNAPAPKSTPVRSDAVKDAPPFMKKLAKITKLPQTARDTVPIEGFLANGIIEVEKGRFIKIYPLHNVNFSIATDEDQKSIFNQFMKLLNSFPESMHWEFTVWNHEIDKRKTIEDIRIKPQNDGLNYYRQEMNQILLKNLQEGNNSITQDRYLIISIEDLNVEHAVRELNHYDEQLNNRLKRICKQETKPLTTMEEMVLLYQIYNQGSDYRLATGVYDDKEEFRIEDIARQGLSVKDMIAPNGAMFDKDFFMLGDVYGRTLYIESIPRYLTTDYLQDITDIQCPMLVSLEEESLPADKSVALVKHRIGDIESEIAKRQKRNAQDGIAMSASPELEHSQESARDLMNDITSRNQKLFFMTAAVTIFAKTKERLEESTKLIMSVSNKHVVPLRPLRFQQEPGLNTSLPLCRNDIFAEKMLTTEGTSAFIPYTTQEVSQKNAIFYGTNQVSKSMTLYDRLTGQNFNGLIFGSSGSGKSFLAKHEITNVILGQPDSQVFIIDPQGEYWPLTKAFHGQRIEIAAGSSQYLNPLDLDIQEVKGASDPISDKVDFVISLFEIINGHRELTPEQTGLLDRATRDIYDPYIRYLHTYNLTFAPDHCPTLADLYNYLKTEQDTNNNWTAKFLADCIYQYAVGTFQTFAHRSNIDTRNRFIVYDISALGTGMKELGLFIATSDVYNRMKQNSINKIKTWFYIDEFHILLKSERTTDFLVMLWKTCRKYRGIPTGIMQNTEDLLANEKTKAIINNTSFVIMLREPLMDRQNLQILFNLSGSQLEYITDSDRGSGILYNGKVKIPFKLNFPKTTKLYTVMTTSQDVAGAQFK